MNFIYDWWIMLWGFFASNMDLICIFLWKHPIHIALVSIHSCPSGDMKGMIWDNIPDQQCEWLTIGIYPPPVCMSNNAYIMMCVLYIYIYIHGYENIDGLISNRAYSYCQWWQALFNSKGYHNQLARMISYKMDGSSRRLKHMHIYIWLYNQHNVIFS